MRRCPFDPDSSVPPGGGKAVAANPAGIILIGALLLGTAGACTANDAQSDPAPTSKTPSPVEIEQDATPAILEPDRKMTVDEKNKRLTDTDSGTVNNPVPPQIMERLIAAAASEARVSADDVVLERADEVTWPDGSLGCPQPNMAYTQALVDGYWVVLHAGGAEFDMRVTRNGLFTRCQGSTKQPPIVYEDH